MGARQKIAAFFVLLATTAFAGCASPEPGGPAFAVSFDGTPAARSAQANAQRVELYLIDDCTSVTLGDRPVPAVASTFILRDEVGALGTTPAAGDYGLYAVAQDSSCAVVAAGCADVTLSDAAAMLSVTLSSIQTLGCLIGQSCAIQTTGECVDGTGGSGGAGGSSGAGGMGGAGGMPLMRVEAGLILLYDFDEGGGTVVADQSGVAPAHDLTIADVGNVTWGQGLLSVDSSTTLSTAGGAAKVRERVVSSGELTMEAWVKPANTTQAGPSRIISMSADPLERNFMLGQELDAFAVRFRASGESDWDNGSPTVLTSSGSASTALTHVMFVHRSNGQEVLYIDGVEDTTFGRSGDTSQWDASYPILVANEATDDRAWLGELHLIALYDRALSFSEVGQNFAAGP
jgi:hypothetical protein